LILLYLYYINNQPNISISINITRVLMKLAFVILLLLMAPQLWADVGSCYVYKIKYILKNGQSVLGYLPITGYDDPMKSIDAKDINQDKQFQLMIIRYFYVGQRQLHFDVYEQIHVVQYKNDDAINTLMPIKFGIVDSGDVIRLNLDSIKYTIYLGTKLADFSWYGVPIAIFDSATASVIATKTVKNFVEVDLTTEQIAMDGSGSAAHLINYNPNITKKDLRAMGEQLRKLSGILPEKKQKPEVLHAKKERQDQLLNQLLEWKEKGVIVCYYHWVPC